MIQAYHFIAQYKEYYAYITLKYQITILTIVYSVITIISIGIVLFYFPDKDYMMKLSPSTKINDLLNHYPFIEEYLINYHTEFKLLKNPIMRHTMRKIADLQKVAKGINMPVENLIVDIQKAIEDHTKKSKNQVSSPEETDNRKTILKNLLKDIHAGHNEIELKHRFAALLQQTNPQEITEIEQSLIKEGISAEEIKQLCNIHVSVFESSLEKQEEIEVPEGHPVDTFLKENKELNRMIDKIKPLLDQLENSEGGNSTKLKDSLKTYLQVLSQVEIHYQRKENQLFPYLEKKGITAPPKVMWAVHDDIRALLKEILSSVKQTPFAGELIPKIRELLKSIEDMFYKEERILFPMSLEALSERDWIDIRMGEEEIGYALYKPTQHWPPNNAEDDYIQIPDHSAAPSSPYLSLEEGLLSQTQLNLILKNLPVDITFVDENDEVRYYSAGRERIFPRSPGVIGRKVQNCHPPKSVDIVNQILEAFKSGRRDEAEFWINLNHRMIHIRYFAIRNDQLQYQGCLEVTQDVTEVQQLKGEKRLLHWEG